MNNSKIEWKSLKSYEEDRIPRKITYSPEGCACKTQCCNQEKDVEVEKERILIDLLFLDLSVCTRCQGTDENLDAAVAEVSRVLESTGREVVVNRVHVLSEELARKYHFVSSPTIRVNGQDIQMDIRESLCESCGDLCGDSVDCRVWVYRGKEYTEPPKAMIMEAILREVYGSREKVEESKEYVLPENLKRFYEKMRLKEDEIHTDAVD